MVAINGAMRKGKNLSGHVSLTRDEARTDAEKSDEAVRLERAASSEGADSNETGVQAAREDLDMACCPYQDKRQRTGKLTWSRAFRNEWFRGFRQSLDDERKDKADEN